MTAAAATKVEKPIAVRSVQRLALAQAISKHAAAVERLQAIESEIESLRAPRIENGERLDRLHEQIKDAEQNAPLSVKRLKEAAAALAGEIDASREHGKALAREAELARRAVASAGSEIDDRIRAVVSADPASTRLAQRVMALHRELAQLVPAIELIGLHLPPELRRTNWWPHPGDRPHASALADQWRSTIEQLRRDPDLMLPEF
jgi:predicted  nucleic acid-binding Zn-ribbon protein